MLKWRFALIAALSLPALASDPLIVHEWGTFTALQDLQGNTLGGINTDDEPVPKFVHVVGTLPILSFHGVPSPRPTGLVIKGHPKSHPHVTMRLETPVTYFYPPANAKHPLEVNVDVAFHGGWLTEFYPNAASSAPGYTIQVPPSGPSSGPPFQGFSGANRLEQRQIGPLAPDTVGTLSWENVQVGSELPGPETDAPVWLAPRQVAAAQLACGDEAERFLFYRGVANRKAPLEILLRGDGGLAAESRFPDAYAGQQIRGLWFIDVSKDGQIAFRGFGPHTLTHSNEIVAELGTPSFAASAYNPGNAEALFAAMKSTLMAEGLFEDEADAMLHTWEASYFKSPGSRLFFTVPQAWTDDVLPLKVSLDARITRVMMGRIDIISPRQQDLLARMSAPGHSLRDLDWAAFSGYLQQENLLDVDSLDRRISAGYDGPPIPEPYRAFIELGRFRNALLFYALDRAPTRHLQEFANHFGLEPMSFPATSAGGIE